MRTLWFTAIIARVPTNHSTPFKVAIEAATRGHAIERLYKLYSNDIYSGVGCNMSEALGELPADADEIQNAIRCPLKL